MDNFERWFHWCIVGHVSSDSASATNWSCYANGQAHAVSTMGPFGLSGNVQNLIGYNLNNSAANCYMDDVRVWRRALGAGEVRAVYDESRRGHPDTLRWITARAVLSARGNRRRRHL